MRNILLFIFLFSTVTAAHAQQQSSVSINPSPITVTPAIHSCSFAEWNGKWIFLGGRKDGLHNFGGGIAFDTFGRNDSVFVVNPNTNMSWSGYLAALPANLYEAVCSSNMEYYQRDSMLYMIGGYGKNDSVGDWITFPTLSAINLNSLTLAVINGTSLLSSFRQIVDSNLAIAGGQLEMTDSTFYLIFGHRFDGLYNSSATAGTFVQRYSHQVRKFNIDDDGTNLSIENYTTITDTNNFHRRDLNVVPQIFPNGDYGFTAFGGVFQKGALLPYLTPIDITAGGTNLNPTFNQNLCQYETASMSVYDSTDNFMHSIFFGGLSLFTYDTIAKVLVKDTLIPFVSTISKVSRDGSGNMVEYKLPVEMPALLGTNAVFIPNRNINLLHNSVINLNALSGNVRVGWITGGIESDYPNIADLDPVGMSRPNHVVYEVYINAIASHLNETVIANNILNINVYPNPAKTIIFVDFVSNESGVIDISIVDNKGTIVKELKMNAIKGTNLHIPIQAEMLSSGLYTGIVSSSNSTKALKFVIRK